MTEPKNIKVNIEIHGTLDADVICEEVRWHLRREIERVGVKPEQLKVGDYVKTLEISACEEIKPGEVLKYSDYDSLDIEFPHEARTLDGRNYGWFSANGLVKVTDEEVAEAKRKQAEAEIEAKWAKIGRKPGELRVGDVVRRAPGYYDIVANIYGGNKLDRGEELVAPVEARFDR